MVIDMLRSSVLLGRIHLRELLGSRRLLFAVLLALVPPAMALIAANFAPPSFGPGRIHAQASFWLLLQIVVPLGSMLVGAGAIADEVEGRTITYLFTRPIPRPALYLGRLGAILLVVVPLFSLCAAATALAAAQREGTVYPDATAGMLRAAAAGAALYALLGATLGIVFRHALIVSLAYVFAIEGMIANFTGSTQRLSIQYWLRSLGVDASEAPWTELRTIHLVTAKLAEQDAAAARLLVISAVILALGCWLIRRRQYVLTS